MPPGNIVLRPLPKYYNDLCILLWWKDYIPMLESPIQESSKYIHHYLLVCITMYLKKYWSISSVRYQTKIKLIKHRLWWLISFINYLSYKFQNRILLFLREKLLVHIYSSLHLCKVRWDTIHSHCLVCCCHKTIPI